MSPAAGSPDAGAKVSHGCAVTVTCEFCQKPYRFDPIDAEQLFADVAPKGSDAIN